MKGASSHAVVTQGVLDLRRRPDHRSEMRSQLLLGETLQILSRSRDGAWRWIRNDADGYEGWVRSWGLREAPAARVRRWRTLARGRIVVPFVAAQSTEPPHQLITPLVWNARVIPWPVRGGRRLVELPDGRRASIPSGALEMQPGSWPLMKRVRSLLGTPYLWGGRSPFGFDCSGWAQQVLAEQGRSVPRDAHEQFHGTERVTPGETRPGDLVFFGPRRGRVSHVGICIVAGFFVHCRGVVRINSLEPGNTLYDRGLADQLRGFGRPHEGGSGAQSS